MSEFLKQDITYLKGVGPKRAALLNKEAKIFSRADLLYYFPFKYIDRTKIFTVSELNGSMSYVQLRGRVTNIEEKGDGGKKRMIARFTDATGSVELVWFRGIAYTIKSLDRNKEYILFGKPTFFDGRVNIVHPELDEAKEERFSVTGKLQPSYFTTEAMKRSYLNSKAIWRIQQTLLKGAKGKIWETLPAWFTQKLKLISLEEALVNIHMPASNELLDKARFRLKFEELFYIQMKILSMKSDRMARYKGHLFEKIGDYFNTFYNDHLPFSLTGAQKRVLKEMRRDMKLGRQMNRLLQGDVGSGKTMVALMTALMAMDNDFQVCLMAPTEILANQHFESISEMLGEMDVKVGLLTGSTGKKQRVELHEGLMDGSLQLLIGTHALIEDSVQYKRLGLVIIDEQHRFGVAQRAKLWKKSVVPPHVLVMTATPIPRTLAMTIYGDLDVSIIDELPPGRKPVQTVHYFENKQEAVFSFIRKQIGEGRQVYMVYPLIQESNKLSYRDLEQGYEQVKSYFPSPKYEVSMVHGRMKPADKDEEMRRFVAGKTHIMVATTVIEVGVNVPNASVMVIESAQKFGLSQLHQLRGRVGRGASQSYCVLMTPYKLSKDARMRMDTMVRTNDGFEIAEADLKLRGPGDMEGTQQSGLAVDLKIANITKDSQILEYARNVAMKIMEEDPLLEKDDNLMFKKRMKAIKQTQFNWGVIS